jgi:integrase
VSELLALTWGDVKFDDLADAEIQFAHQVDRQGRRRPTKTDGSARTVAIPHELALMLVRHKLAARYAQAGDFVFSTRTGEAIRQPNVCRALRTAQRDAADDLGRPTFPVLHESDARVAHGELPSMHSFLGVML